MLDHRIAGRRKHRLRLLNHGRSTWVDLPADHRTWDNESSTWGYSSHGEAVATLAIAWYGVLISANAGYRVTSMTHTDPDSADHTDDYLIHGFVVGGAIGFTF